VGSRPGSQFLQLFNFAVVLSISVGVAFEFKLPLLPQHCLLDGEASFVVFLHFVEARRDGSNFLIGCSSLFFISACFSTVASLRARCISSIGTHIVF
jgi:hypothetical protein